MGGRARVVGADVARRLPLRVRARRALHAATLGDALLPGVRVSELSDQQFTRTMPLPHRSGDSLAVAPLRGRKIVEFWPAREGSASTLPISALSPLSA